MSFREVPGAGRREFVAGLEKVRPERWEGRCAICGLTDGAVMACQQPSGCGNAFHVLCARNIGLYLSEGGGRAGVGGGEEAPLGAAPTALEARAVH